MEFVRVTEAAAIACGHLVGRGDKNGADGLADTADAGLDADTGKCHSVFDYLFQDLFCRSLHDYSV